MKSVLAAGVLGALVMGTSTARADKYDDARRQSIMNGNPRSYTPPVRPDPPPPRPTYTPPPTTPSYGSSSSSSYGSSSYRPSTSTYGSSSSTASSYGSGSRSGSSGSRNLVPPKPPEPPADVVALATGRDVAALRTALPSAQPAKIAEALLASARAGRSDSLAAIVEHARATTAERRSWIVAGYGSALVAAARSGFDEPVRTLLAAGASADAADPEPPSKCQGSRVLHSAAHRGFTSIVTQLVKNGADVEAKDGCGATPEDLARPLTTGETLLEIRRGYVFAGKRAENGDGVTKDALRALALYEKGCTSGLLDGCFYAGRLLRGGGTVTRDDARAFTHLSKSCPAVAQGCGELGVMHRDGAGTKKDPSRARELLFAACAGKDAASCTALGVMLLRGEGVAKKDPEQAGRLFQLACDGVSTSGCAELGSLHADGVGVAKDPQRAMTLYKRACDANVLRGCGLAATAYATGKGAVADATAAATLGKRACDGGESSGCVALAHLSREGLGTTKDDARAKELVGRACDLKDADACKAVGRKPN